MSGRYEIVRLLGTGAFGKVYLARHINLNVFRAIKCISLCQDSYATAYREADILKNLRHPSIPIIYDIEQDDNYVYIIEEYVEGVSIRDLISKGKFNIREVTGVTLQLCSVLSYMHKNNTYHLDIKPDNIIYDKGNIKLIDYGSAVSDGSEVSVRMGTRGYAAPEMYGREKINSGSDVYSIGVLMLYMLTGKTDITALESVRNHDFKGIIEACICHSSSERIVSFEELNKKLVKFNKKKPVENVSLRIHVGGIEKHCGCTHTSLAIGRIMRRRGYRTVVCENNDSEDYTEMVKYYDFRFSKGVFTIQNNLIVPNYHGFVTMDFLEGYDRIICDYGCIDENNLKEFLSGDMLYIVSGTRPYELVKMKSFCDKVLIPLNETLNFRVLLNYSDAGNYKSVIRRYDIPNPVRIPYEPDVFNSKKDWLI